MPVNGKERFIFSLSMNWNTGDVWSARMRAVDTFEFKFIVIEKDKVKKWEASDNRQFQNNLFVEVFEKQKSYKNVFITNHMTASYDYNRKTITLHCIWK